MAKVNSESSNTDAMFRHQLLKKNKQSADTKKNVEVDFGVEESAGTKIFDWRLTNCLNARAPAPSAGAGGAAASSSEAPPAGGKSKSSEGSGSFSGVEKILVPQDRRHHLASDADSQLLLRVFFNGPVTVTGLQFRCDEAPKFACKSEGGEEEDDDFQPPNNVQIFANQDGLDFSDIEDYKPALAIELTELAETGKTEQKIVCSGPKFARVSSLQIFVVDAQEDAPFTFLNYLGITGFVAPDYHNSYR